MAKSCYKCHNPTTSVVLTVFGITLSGEKCTVCGEAVYPEDTVTTALKLSLGIEMEDEEPGIIYTSQLRLALLEEE